MFSKHNLVCSHLAHHPSEFPGFKTALEALKYFQNF